MPPSLLDASRVDQIIDEICTQAPESPAWHHTDEGLPAHAHDGPSAFPRLFKCPGSLSLSKLLHSPDSQYSYEGSVAHELGERAFKTNRNTREYLGEPLIETPDQCDPVVVTRDMCDHIDEWLVYCASIGTPSSMRYAENIVSLQYWSRQCFGSCDFLVVDIDRMEIDVIDLKYGEGVPVNAANTPQPLGYALGSIWALAAMWGVRWNRVGVHIVQPRLDSITHEDYTVREVLSFGEHLRLHLAAARDELSEAFFPSVDACQFCAAKPSCEPRARHYESIIKQAAEDIPTPKAVHSMPVERLAILLDDMTGSVRFCNSLKNAALQRALDGVKLPGKKLVPGMSSRQWQSEEAIRAAMQRHTDSEDNAFKEPKLKTPAEIEREFGKAFYNEHIKPLVIERQGKLTLVDESDPREEVERVERYADLVK